MKLSMPFILAGGLAAAISAAEPAEARNKFGFLGRTFGAPSIPRENFQEEGKSPHDPSPEAAGGLRPVTDPERLRSLMDLESDDGKSICDMYRDNPEGYALAGRKNLAEICGP